MERQLSIRSDEAVALLDRLARARGATKADTVVAALRLLETNDNPPPIKANPAMERVQAAIERIHAQYPHGLPPEEDMYDEHGLPI
jgi:hypothetical protein